VDVVFAWRDSISIQVQMHTLLVWEIPAVSIHDFAVWAQKLIANTSIPFFPSPKPGMCLLV
jgi:hypothetical protein